MVATGLNFQPLDRAPFGVALVLGDGSSAGAADEVLAAGALVRDRLVAAGGLMVVRGFTALAEAPQELVRLSRIFGPEVENYRETLTAARFFHDTEPEVLVLSNLPPCNHPPPPRPAAGAELAVQFPDRKNWHTDQSYRRPPPDISLLYGVKTPPPDQGQTLFADCTAAHAALDPKVRDRLSALNGIHAPSWIGRTPDDVRAGATLKPLLPHQRPQRQPLVRVHPDSGRPALYICEEKQMDFVEGPIEGLEPGPDGAGAELLRDLLRHATQSRFTYVHAWAPGDLVIADNRCLLHAATWYDAQRHHRLMWRTTVMGNPGAEYAGEAKSWIPAAGYSPMQGMENA